MRGAKWGWLCTALVLAASGEIHASAPALKSATLVAGRLEQQGKRLVAGADGARLRLSAELELRAEPGTTFRLGSRIEVPSPRAASRLVPARVVIVERGRVDVALPFTERPGSACLLTGPGKLQLSIVEGQATLIVREGESIVASERGAALASNGGGWLRLAEGSARVFAGDDKKGVERSLPPAPAPPTLSRRLLLAGGGPQSTTRVSWAEPGGAAAHEIAIEDLSTGERRISPARARGSSLGELAPGRYAVALRALDEAGLAGAWSERVPLKVIAVEAPPQARREDSGAFSLLPGQRVRLIGAEGFEVAYAGLDRYVPVPDSLGLVQRRPITARLRDPESGQQVNVRLEPLTVKATIELPRSPRRWPSGGVPITVRLKDQRGRPVSGVHADVRVSVNLEPQALAWREGEGTWSSVIESPVGAAPWLVRVDVLDERGVSLGKDFAEIAYEAAPSAATKRP